MAGVLDGTGNNQRAQNIRKKIDEMRQQEADRKAMEDVQAQLYESKQQLHQRRAQDQSKFEEQIALDLVHLHKMSQDMVHADQGGYETFTSIMNKVLRGTMYVANTSPLHYPIRALAVAIAEYTHDARSSHAKPSPGEVPNIEWMTNVTMDEDNNIKYSGSIKLPENIRTQLDEGEQNYIQNYLDAQNRVALHLWLKELNRTNGDRYTCALDNNDNPTKYQILDRGDAINKAQFNALRDDPVHGFTAFLQKTYNEKFVKEEEPENPTPSP